MERQAVLLIHGIGEQKPMDTLRGFIDSVWTRATDIHNPFAAENAGAVVWSKPDTVSKSFELRRLTTIENSAGIRTDFFEFYWQHLLEGTTYSHVFAWLKTLLWRSPSSIPKQLQPAYWLLWPLCVVAVGLALYTAAGAVADQPPVSPWLSAIVSLLLVPVAGFVIKSIIGDAARYLHVAPGNVQCRHAIREAGLTLLTTLHSRREYERIILVGHSLGSVIGFDILTHAWPRYHRTISAPTATVAALDALEALDQTAVPVEKIQEAQRACFNELVANGNKWRVTDFVTLGSPLAHAAILLARDPNDLRSKQQQREVPRCLPERETVKRNHQFISRFSFEYGGQEYPGHRVPHHAAVFGPTRWTNLYFPNKAIVIGDLIGGPLHEVFGPGVHDIPVETTQRFGLFSHTLYWQWPPSPGGATPSRAQAEATPAHIGALQAALDLRDSRNVSAWLPDATSRGASFTPKS